MSFFRKIRSGKNVRIKYYIFSYIYLHIPHFVLKMRLNRLLKSVAKRKDYDEIKDRVDYYCKLSDASAADKKEWMNHFVAIGKQKVVRPKVYYLDSYCYARYFNSGKKWNLCTGDVNYVPQYPSITKSRPICNDNANATLLNLDKIRHFIFLKDKKKWTDKRDMIIFRGALGQKDGNEFKQNRYKFMKMYFGNPMCDLGEIAEGGKCVNPEWQSPKLTLYQHLDYKFILSLEGNDVASNLKWVMSSNSIAVMPRPTCESWFMEGRLIPNVHYIEISPSFEDLEEKLNYYINNPDEAQKIIDNAHEYVKKFRNRKREEIVSLLVLQKYINKTNI